jgi:hypothetical protein
LPGPPPAPSPKGSVLDVLPADLACLAPAVRAMLAVRAKFRAAVDSKKFPDAAAGAKLDQCENQCAEILYEALKKKYSGENGAAFNRQVIVFGDTLWKWLNDYRGDRNTPEVALLFDIVGTIPRAKEKTWFERAGTALGAAYARYTRPEQK